MDTLDNCIRLDPAYDLDRCPLGLDADDVDAWGGGATAMMADNPSKTR